MSEATEETDSARAAVHDTINRYVQVRPVVRGVLLSLTQRVPSRGIEVLADDDTLDPEVAEAIVAILGDAESRSPAEMAERIGDALRAAGRALDADVVECYRAAFYLGDSWEPMATNPLFARFCANKAHMPFDKWIHYFDVYAQVLAPYVGTDVRVLEIGVFHGGGLDQLRALLGEQAVLVGADVDPASRAACEGRFEVAIGDQSDPEFLAHVVSEYGPFDVIIDDGGHSMRQQITSMEHLFPTLNEGGLYLVEDTHTSYWDGYQDYDQTFMNWVKDRLDDVNGYHHNTDEHLPIWTTHVQSICVFDSIVAVSKKRRFPPFCEVVGTGSFILNDRISESSLLAYDAALTLRGAQLRAAAAEVKAVTEQAHAEAAEARRERDVAIASAVENARERDQAAQGLQTIADMENSVSWRITAPMRKAKARVKDYRDSM